MSSQPLLPRLSLDPGWTCAPVDRSGARVYVHLIRADDDPERQERARSVGGQGADARLGWRALRRLPVEEVAELIRAHLADGIPRTFNRICVELWDKTADVAFEGAPDRALWWLVERGEVEHTQRAPILFRRRRGQ